MKNILVPIDFSDASGNSLLYAHALAKHLKMTITLLHCYPVNDYSRKYKFKEANYNLGIESMLKDFYRKHITDKNSHCKLIIHKGGLLDKTTALSRQFDLIVISGKKFGSSISRWLGSKSSSIASQSHCPVLKVPFLEQGIVFSGWKKIWHIKRRENETAIIEERGKKLKINSASIAVKTLDQTTFSSSYWKSMLSYIQGREKIDAEVLHQMQNKEGIDLFLLVSHGKDNFKKFTNDKATQLIFKFDIPLLIFQEES